MPEGSSHRNRHKFPSCGISERTVKMEDKQKKSSTTLICELTRLKSQQKYLECSQYKVNVNNFSDYSLENPKTKSSIVGLINEIDVIKSQLEDDLQRYHEAAKLEVQDMWSSIKTLKEDIFQPERLRCYSLNTIRQRIIQINTELARLNAKIESELLSLKNGYEKAEKLVQINIK